MGTRRVAVVVRAWDARVQFCRLTGGKGSGASPSITAKIWGCKKEL